MVPRSLPTFFSPDPTTRGSAGPRVLEYPGRGVQTALSGSSGKREDRPGHPAFPRERTPCIALPSASCPSVLWSFFLSVPLCLCLSLSGSLALSDFCGPAPQLDSQVLPPSLSQLPSGPPLGFCPICVCLYPSFSLLFAWLSCFFEVLTSSEFPCPGSHRRLAQ